jgi:hypothetical protein
MELIESVAGEDGLGVEAIIMHVLASLWKWFEEGSVKHGICSLHQ